MDELNPLIYNNKNKILIQKAANINSINKNDKKNNLKYRYYFLDILRIISSFSIIVIHVSGYYFYKLNINSNNWKICYYFNGISRFGVPIFIMISGALFLEKDISFKMLYKKYIKSLFVNLIFWSFIYSLNNIIISRKNFEKIIQRILSIHYHLWYLITNIGLYMIVPFLAHFFLHSFYLKKNLIIIFSNS